MHCTNSIIIQRQPLIIEEPNVLLTEESSLSKGKRRPFIPISNELEPHTKLLKEVTLSQLMVSRTTKIYLMRYYRKS